MGLGDNKNTFTNAKILLEEIIATSAADVLAKMRQSFETDDWSEELKIEAISTYSVAIMGILAPCAIANSDILDVFAKGADDNKTLVHFMYPAIVKAIDDAASRS
ncbi:MAG: hypothetical protein J6Y02_23780 [Pseudobutyrivibrio sp.]|nr:hypothetical protein [Pseudobutyrivibrio sp.]